MEDKNKSIMGTMVSEEVFDISDLVAETSSASSYNEYGDRYPGLSVKEKPSIPGERKLSLHFVKNANEKFITLFGLPVGIESGDIALGLFPDGDNYIRIDNLWDILDDILNTVISVSNNRHDMSHSDNSNIYFGSLSIGEKKYILEYLKLNPIKAVHVMRECIESCLRNDILLKNKSLTLRLVNTRSTSSNSLYRNVSEVFSNGIIESLVLSFTNKLISMYRISKTYFVNHIVESDISGILYKNKGIRNILDYRNGNAESLYRMYVDEYGLPDTFIRGISQYGYGIKEKSKIISYSKSYSSKNLSSADMGEILSAYSYMDGTDAIWAVTRSYNILDLLRAIGSEEDILFSIDLSLNYNVDTLIENRIHKFHLDDILDICEITLKDFVVNVGKYEKSLMLINDLHGMYKRKVTHAQYCFSMFSSDMIRSAGVLFDRVGKMVLKKFDKEEE